MSTTEKQDQQWGQEWNELWKPLLLTNGEFDETKIKNEMHDLVFIFNQVSEVYMYITGGLLSKPMYYASVIKQKFDDAVNEAAEEQTSEELEIQRTAFIEDLKSFFKKWGYNERHPGVFTDIQNKYVTEFLEQYQLPQKEEKHA